MYRVTIRREAFPFRWGWDISDGALEFASGHSLTEKAARRRAYRAARRRVRAPRSNYSFTIRKSEFE